MIVPRFLGQEAIHRLFAEPRGKYCDHYCQAFANCPAPAKSTYLASVEFCSGTPSA
jgi:hypothetical protein